MPFIPHSYSVALPFTFRMECLLSVKGQIVRTVPLFTKTTFLPIRVPRLFLSTISRFYKKMVCLTLTYYYTLIFLGTMMMDYCILWKRFAKNAFSDKNMLRNVSTVSCSGVLRHSNLGIPFFYDRSIFPIMARLPRWLYLIVMTVNKLNGIAFVLTSLRSGNLGETCFFSAAAAAKPFGNCRIDDTVLSSHDIYPQLVDGLVRAVRMPHILSAQFFYSTNLEGL